MAVILAPNPANLAFVPTDYGVHSTAVGTTRRNTVDGPFQRANVVLFDQSRMLAIREMWSDETTGQWQFHNLRAGVFFVVSPDPLGLKNGEIVTDIVVPTP
jgi:hypothetical protein